MASPFSLEEKQILLESLDINVRKEKMEQILNNYIQDEFENTTLQSAKDQLDKILIKLLA
mgnify:CR=1 FL=1